ncbi:MAG: type I restriction enzyme HsdR N-terminal domain-containing protein [Bacteroidales bacterium]|jgi:hypothetical protein|nr:type I restriction enzyme HsdR N-terminal domain-containing protein [Bacteroidales bacterium]MDD4256899.1 type I restriction enzyme HsdR N-terminal domain-containing protein [Bacteroidales bacterium]MDD4654098.1 type I restriction enzyme HsdR N-terminal domain-containing protein [Bacteroidales bacterium]MDD4827762.1 type I restriction enzyme HsdR N-terminal domain-containing protein [Bacteroidales bacterium]HPS23983.1 type I restriction enzyme HsdR N-terminal domain-containing protein [Bacte
MNDPNLIYCLVRKKWIVRTPEEEVRQNMIRHLHLVCGAPLHLMACEYPIELNGRSFRADLVLHDRHAEPLILAEFKAPQVALGPSALDQLKRYNTVLLAPYLLIGNNRQTYFCKFNINSQAYEFLNEIPSFEQLL